MARTGSAWVLRCASARYANSVIDPVMLRLAVVVTR